MRRREQVLFRTTDQSWHGLPDAVASPPGVNRNRYSVLSFIWCIQASLTRAQSCRLLRHGSSTIGITTFESAGSAAKYRSQGNEFNRDLQFVRRPEDPVDEGEFWRRCV
jgi:hypothetical protein